MTRLPVHVDLGGFEVAEDCLTVGGRKLTDVMASAPDVPHYIYDSSLVRNRVDELRRALPDSIKLHYAMKANPLPELVAFIAGLVDGIDVASAGELEVALSTQVPVTEISFAGPGKRPEEIRRAIEAGITLNVESTGELQRAAAIADELGRPAQVALRVNPDFELKGSGMRMSGGPKPFGIDAEVIPNVLESLPDTVQFQGFHIFSGSQNLDAEAICDAQRQSVDLALTLADDSGLAPRFINIGGGFGIPYFPKDTRLDLAPIGENLSRLAERVAQRFPDADIVVELGRFLVGEAGLYVCSVVDKKVSRGTTYLVTNGGLHHHLALSGNFGQLLRKNYPLVVGNRVFGDGATEEVSIVGPLCTPLDILGDKMTLPTADVGDLIAVFQSGAYGYSASPRGFLSHPDAVEVFL